MKFNPIKRAGFIAVILVLALAMAGCAGGNPPAASPSASQEQLVLTLEELAAYNGKDGNPAYIAVDGVIYDVTNSSRWKNGDHNGFEAGQDLTDAIKNQSPHGTSTLQRMPVVGTLAQ